MITLQDLISATGGQLLNPAAADAWEDFCYDSRLAQPGQLFVALRTPSGDGHDHIAEAIARGCTGVLCQHPHADQNAITTILVPDTGDALRAWAAHILRKHNSLIIAITGSSGKTTTKELAADFLESHYPGRIFRTPESYNDRLGIPLALARLTPDHRIAVIEVGTDAHGEIRALASLLQPTIAAITTINDAHLGVFGSLDAIATEKASLLQALPSHGIAILNADDPLQQPLLERKNHHLLPHSSSRPTPLQLHPASGRRPHQVLCKLDPARIPTLEHPDPNLVAPSPYTGPTTFTLCTHLLGQHQLVSIRTAIAIALLLRVPIPNIQATIANFRPLPGRLCPLPGVAHSLLLDDTYSANPAATRAALRVLGAHPAPRIAILGQHSGLGAAAETRLNVLATHIRANCDHLITVGEQAQILAHAAQTAGMPPSRLHHADTPAAAAEIARSLLSRLTTPSHHATILLKGSREARLERTTARLLADPQTAEARLPRQNPAWQHVRLRNTLRPTWVEIDTLAIADNLKAVRRRLQPGVKLIAVLKADAYGHGAATVARIVTQAGADMIAVACLPEAIALRRAGITLPILILGYTPPWQVRTALEFDIHLTLYDPDVALALEQAATALDKRAPVHVKVDTGMGRLGLLPPDVPPFLRRLHALPHLHIVGLFTHMAIADEPQDPHTDLQLQRFNRLLAELEALDMRPPLVHAANTATLLTRPDAHYDAVRLGIGLYGLAPAPGIPLPADFRPAMTWKTTIAQVKTLPPGSPVGYGLTYRTTGQQTIAIIPVGYADGFRRAPKNWGEVLVRGRRAPLVGRVSMDQAALDVSHIPAVRPGDEVVLIGCQGDECLTADDVAERLGTINYEVISAILARVPRMPE